MKNLRTFDGFKKFESKEDKFPNIKTIEIDGYQILMGRDAQSNDHLSINMADPDDLWFHTKGFPGSHLIIRCNNKLVTPEVKIKVAELAKKNSKGKDKECVVVCCKAKFVKKSSDMKPGQVSVDYKNAEEISIKN